MEELEIKNKKRILKITVQELDCQLNKIIYLNWQINVILNILNNFELIDIQIITIVLSID